MSTSPGNVSIKPAMMDTWEALCWIAFRETRLRGNSRDVLTAGADLAADAVIEGARRELLATIGFGKLDWEGQRVVAGREPDEQSNFEKIPAELATVPAATISDWGSFGPSPAYPIAVVQWRKPRYRSVRFQRSEVLALWPPTAPVAAVSREPLEPSSLPPFDPAEACRILRAAFTARPSEVEARQALASHFGTMSRGKVRDALQKAFGPGKIGRRPKAAN